MSVFIPFFVGEHIHKHRKLENFYLSSTHGSHASSLFSKWFVCSHMQQCRAYDVFIILLTPCKPLFLCCFKQPHLLFSCYLQNPHMVKSFLLLGPATLTSAFFFVCFFCSGFFFPIHYEILVLWYSQKTWKNLLVLTSIPTGCRSAVLSSMSPATHLFHSIEPPSSLSNIIHCSEFDFCVFFQNGLQMMFFITQLRRTLNARMYS